MAETMIEYPILAVDDDPSFLAFLGLELKKIGTIATASNLDEAYSQLESGRFGIVLLDVGLGKENGLSALREIKQKYPASDVVMVSGQKDPHVVVEAIRSGAADYLTKPLEIEELLAVIEKIRPLQRMRERHDALIESVNRLEASFVIGNSREFQAMLRVASKVKGKDVPVLIEGESGTGKELVARYIHRQEENNSRPFVTVNCAAIPENLLESELFGHERGAFTGATTRKVGQFEMADGGDIFLDEISCLKFDLQAKLLRVLQEHEFTRVGGTERIQSHFRVIAATNDNLEKGVESEKFRRDLYHRLRVITLKIPPLRERKEDIPSFVEAFLQKYDSGRSRGVEPAVMEIFQSYRWPGNVRELENLLRSLIILAEDDVIKKKNLPRWVFENRAPKRENGPDDFLLPSSPSEIRPLEEYVDRAERAYVERTLQLTGGDKTKVATLLKISRTRLYERLKAWGMMS